MRVLALGLSRSGTDSLRNALLELGYGGVMHGYEGFARVPPTVERFVQLNRRKFTDRSDPNNSSITAADFDAIIGDCDAVTDLPCAALGPELIAAYPDAKVILNTRELDAWYASFNGTLMGLQRGWVGWQFWLRSWFCAELYWMKRSIDVSMSVIWYGDFQATGQWVYRQHANAIRGQVPADRLLEWSVQDGWGPLCDFLGHDVPKGKEFPRGNAPVQFQKRVDELLGAYQRRADRNIAITAAVVFGGLGLGYLAWNGWTLSDTRQAIKSYIFRTSSGA